MDLFTTAARGITSGVYKFASNCGSSTGSCEHGRELIQKTDPESFSKGLHYLQKAVEQGNSEAPVILKVECLKLAGDIHHNSSPAVLSNFRQLLFAAFPPGERFCFIQTQPGLQEAIPQELRITIFNDNDIAAKEGNVDALYECGLMKYEGYGVTCSLIDALQCLLDAQSKGHPLAKNPLQEINDKFVSPYVNMFAESVKTTLPIKIPEDVRYALVNFIIFQKTKITGLSPTERLTITHSDIINALDDLNTIINKLAPELPSLFEKEQLQLFKNREDFSTLLAESLSKYNLKEETAVAIVTKPPPPMSSDEWKIIYSMTTELFSPCKSQPNDWVRSQLKNVWVRSQLNAWVRFQLKEYVTIPSRYDHLTFYTNHPHLRKVPYIGSDRHGINYLKALGITNEKIKELNQQHPLSKTKFNEWIDSFNKEYQDNPEAIRLIGNSWFQQKVSEGLIDPGTVLNNSWHIDFLQQKNTQKLMDSHPQCLYQLSEFSSYFKRFLRDASEEILSFLCDPKIVIENLFKFMEQGLFLLKDPEVREFLVAHPEYLDSYPNFADTLDQTYYPVQSSVSWAFSYKIIRDRLISGELTIEKLRDCPLTFNTVCNYEVLKILNKCPTLWNEVMNLKVPFNDNALKALQNPEIQSQLIAGTRTFDSLNDLPLIT